MTFDSPYTRRTLSRMSLLVIAAMAVPFFYSPLLSMLGLNSQAEAELLAELEKQPEAREWIRNNHREGPLASNRFEGTADALAFVNSLYEAGAVRVVVYAINDDKIEMAEGGPYAEALIVRLPADAAKRRRLIAIAHSESLKKWEPVADIGRETLYFWWD
jgi:hypothetical protein